ELQAEIRNKKILSVVEKNNKEINKEIENLQKTFDKKFAEWEVQVSSLKKVSELKNKLERYKFDLEKAEREQNYEEASRIKYSLIPELEKELGAHSHEWILSRTHVANVISRHTGIPVEKILKSRQDSLLKLEDVLQKRVYGQKEAIHEISETLLSSYAGLTAENRPLGSFLLLG